LNIVLDEKSLPSQRDHAASLLPKEVSVEEPEMEL
jgi:hypothetical protein